MEGFTVCSQFVNKRGGIDVLNEQNAQEKGNEYGKVAQMGS